MRAYHVFTLQVKMKNTSDVWPSLEELPETFISKKQTKGKRETPRVVESHTNTTMLLMCVCVCVSDPHHRPMQTVADADRGSSRKSV